MPQGRLLRFVRDPDGRVRADPERRHEGRGAYLCGKPECASGVRDGRAFARSFRAPVTVDQETLDFTGQWQRSESIK